MTTETKTKEYNIDAKDRKLGRLASEVASILQGKDSLDFARHNVSDVKIKISNASKMDISQKKLDDKRYKSFSGYPSGLKMKSGNEIAKVHGFGELLKKAVHGMLPTNKLRSRMLKNLEITE